MTPRGLVVCRARKTIAPNLPRRMTMPLITVSYATSRQSPSLKADIAAAVSELTAGILHKDPKVTAVIVKSVDAGDWFAGGKSLAEQKLASYWIDLHVN